MKHIIYVTIAGVLVLAFLGCATQGSSVKSEKPVPEFTSLEQGDVTISARYLSRKHLIDRYGERNNPFHVGQQVIVEFNALTQSEVVIDPSQVELELKNKVKNSVHKESIKSLWWNYIGRERVDMRGDGYSYRHYRNWDYNEVKRLIDQNMLSERSTQSDILILRRYDGVMVFWYVVVSPVFDYNYERVNQLKMFLVIRLTLP
jgi:hypothetical protein